MVRYILPYLFCLTLFLGGCASSQGNLADGVQYSDNTSASVETVSSQSGDDEFEDYGDEDTPVIADPLEGWNRFWFSFNDFFIRKVAKPVYQGYEAVTPQIVRSGLSNFYENLLAPARIVNRILQGEFGMAMVELDRFIVNTILGFGGFASFNDQLEPLVPFKETGANFDGTLKTWGVGEGCYLVLPFLGPSTVRNAVGLAGDSVSDPLWWGTQPYGKIPERVSWSVWGVDKVNSLGGTIKAYEALTDSAVEPYTSVRDAYITLMRKNGEK